MVLTDGAAHAVDSSELAFKLAAQLAFKQGYERAAPVILEPIMAVEVGAGRLRVLWLWVLSGCGAARPARRALAFSADALRPLPPPSAPPHSLHPPQITAPTEFQGTVIGDVNRRKGVIMGSEQEGDDVVIQVGVAILRGCCRRSGGGAGRARLLPPQRGSVRFHGAPGSRPPPPPAPPPRRPTFPSTKCLATPPACAP